MVNTGKLELSGTFDGNSAPQYGGAVFSQSAQDGNRIVNAQFTENTAKNGGAVFNAGNLEISGNFTGNSAQQYAGAVYNNKGTMKLSGNFTDNSAQQLGGAVVNTGTMEVAGNFNGNSAEKSGGAIYNTGTLEIASGTMFEKNRSEVTTGSSSGGGAIYSSGSGNLKVNKGVIFSENSVEELIGGAVFDWGSSDFDGVTFQNNKAKWGGAIYQGNKNSRTDVKNSFFIANSAQSVGAAGIFGEAAFDNVTFTDNKASADAGYAGAVLLGSESHTVISNSTFERNSAAGDGGALITRKKEEGNNRAAFLDLTDSVFTGNTAQGKGGAIYNTFYHSQADENSVYVADSTFTENTAKNGGAIYNAELLDTNKDKQISAMTVKNGVFTGNTAAENGGAVYNAGILNLQGNNTFSGNTAAGNANDIYNLGTLNIADGKTVLEGGVNGTGEVNVASGAVLDIGLSTLENNAVTFASGSTLGVTLASDKMGGIKADTITVGTAETDQAKLLVTLSKDFLTDTTGVTKQLTNGTEVTNGAFAMADVTNALYDVSFDAQTNEVTAVRKSQEEQEQAIADAGGNGNNADVIDAFTSSSDLGSDAANQTADIINQLAQTDTAAAVSTAKALAPEEAAIKRVVHGSAARQLFSAIDAHINTAFADAPRTYALADDNQALYNSGKNYSVWAQGLVNKSHKEEASVSAFTGRSTGLAGGADMKLGEDWIAGLGYAYLHTNVDSFNRHNRILGDNFFLYGQYRPGRFFVQGAFTYGDSKYEEDKYLPGLTADADYHVKSYAANLSAGYELNEWLTPMLGLRYMNLQQEGYTDSSDQAVSAEQDNYLTGILGAKLRREYRLAGLRLLPQINAGVAYDFVSDGNDSSVSLPNGAAYDVDGERLHRLSFETGASVAALVSDNVEVALAYDGNFRRDYNSHTGSLKLRYMF